MKWAYYIKYKIRTVAFLAAILLVVLLGNFVERNSYTILDNSIASIYKDRLEVSQFLYEISNSLYQKRLILSEKNVVTRAINAEVNIHNININKLIEKYEETVLTKEEKTKWLSFKNSLSEYNYLEKQWLISQTKENYISAISQFKSTIVYLDALSNIQVGEGHHILEDSHSIVNNRLVFSSFEISLLIILGIFSLIIISATDTRIFKSWQNEALN